MSTTWNATATLRQAVQRAYAYASLRWSTLAPSRIHRNALRTSTSVAPSRVLMTRAWLSPGFGSRGGSYGKSHADSAGAGSAAAGAGAGSGGGSGSDSGSGAAAGGAAAAGSSGSGFDSGSGAAVGGGAAEGNSGSMRLGSRECGVRLPVRGRSGTGAAGGAAPGGADPDGGAAGRASTKPSPPIAGPSPAGGCGADVAKRCTAATEAGRTLRVVRALTGSSPRSSGCAAASRPSRSVASADGPRRHSSFGPIGRYWPPGHHAQPTPVTTRAPARTAATRSLGRPVVPRQTRPTVRRTMRTSRYAIPATGSATVTIRRRQTARAATS